MFGLISLLNHLMLLIYIVQLLHMSKFTKQSFAAHLLEANRGPAYVFEIVGHWNSWKTSIITNLYVHYYKSID